MRLAHLFVGTGLIVASVSAVGQTTLGHIGGLANAGYSQCSSNLMVVQSATASPYSYTVPQNGTITSWSFASPSPGFGGNTEALVILRSTGGSNYTIVGITSPQTVAEGQAGTFSTSIAVQTGDLVGLWIPPATQSFCLYPGTSGDAIPFNAVPNPSAGNSVSLSFGPIANYLANISATLSPPQPSTTAVPTLSELGLLSLAVAILAAAGSSFRRRSGWF